MAQRRPRRLDTLATPSRPVPFTARLLRRSPGSRSASPTGMLEPLVLPSVGSAAAVSSPPSPTIGGDRALDSLTTSLASMRQSSSLPILPGSERRGMRWWRADPELFVPTHKIYGIGNPEYAQTRPAVQARQGRPDH